ncbi:MAG: cyclic peptide export ABC transporter [Clostridium sp.]|nr:cyclic peptide export ABC transporter [Clostridium sp.]
MKKNKKIIIILSIIFTILISQLNVNALSDNINYLNEDKNTNIENLIKENMDKGKLPGVAVAIVKGNQTIYQKGFGYSNVKEQKEVTADSLFELGSNSKAYTGLGILKLEEEGKINLNDDVSKYIPWLKFKYKGSEVSVTVNQFLQQTSGVPFNTIDKIPVSDSSNAIEETVRRLEGLELYAKPGENFQYATINYDVLGLVIEKVTGKPYESYIEDSILKPLNLTNTYLFRNEELNSKITTGYKLGMLKQNVYDAPIYRGNKPAGYIISNIEDMSKWLKIQMGAINNEAINTDLLKKSHGTGILSDSVGKKEFYTSGWFINLDNEVYHGGNNPNYSSYIKMDMNDKVGVVVLCNTNSDYTESIAEGIMQIMQGKSVISNISDLNQKVDIICVIAICILVILILTTLTFTAKAIVESIKKQRYFRFNGFKTILSILLSLLFVAGTIYCIKILPEVVFGGLSWQFIFVWLPSSVKTTLILLYALMFLVYVYFVFTSLFKKTNSKNIVALLLLSIFSGFGNALIIFTINTCIRSDDDLRFKLLIYFIFGIVLYVYGQKLMRERLIDFTNGIVYNKRMTIVSKLLETQYSKYEQIEKGRIESTLNNDTETISRFVNILIGGVTSAVTLICCFIYLGTINIYALLLSIVIILVIASIYFLYGKYANRIGEESRDLQNVFFKFINDLNSGIKELSLNGRKRNEFKEDMEKSCYDYKAKRNEAELAFANMFIIGELLFTLAIGSVVFVFPYILKNLDATSLTSYVFVLLYMVGPVHGILETIPNTIDVNISFKRINNLINDITIENETACTISEDIEDNICLKLDNVEYEYEESEGNSFKVGPINYEFKSGEIVFITGGNGSGKSTLGKLLTGLYSPTKGEVYLNNNTSQKFLNESYSTVFADFHLFDKLYGINYKGREDEIQKYLEILQLDKKVKVEDGRFSTTRLSTGQKKRLALLVTYLEDKPICLFDEWAADQDPEFRKFFYENLLPDLKTKGKCIIAVTHDDRYFNIADKVIKMDLGKIRDI